jgi:hypothetical protein
MSISLDILSFNEYSHGIFEGTARKDNEIRAGKVMTVLSLIDATGTRTVTKRDQIQVQTV